MFSKTCYTIPHMLPRSKTFILILILLGLALYFNSLFNGFFLSDDEDQIINNPLITSVQNIPQIFAGSTYFRPESDQRFGPFYRPLMLTSFSLTYALFGLDPLFYHLFQIILHTVNALLVFFLFKHFFKPGLAFILAAVFLVHPINSEVILHAANTQEALFMFFGLASLILSTTFNRHTSKDGPSTSATLIYLATYATLLLLALLGKETAVAFAVIIPLYIWIAARPNFLPVLLSSGAAVIAYLILRIQIASIFIAHQALAAFGDLSLPERLLHAPAITTSYLKTYFFPHLILNGYHWTIDKFGFGNFILPLIIVVITNLYLIALIRRTRRHSPQHARFLFFFLVWLWLGLGLHLHILALETTLTDRWFYFPQIGLLGIIGYLLTTLPNESLIYRKATLITAIVLATLSARTFIRTFDWRTSQTLILSDLAHDPGNYYFQNLLGSIYLEEGNIKAATPHVLASVAIRPNFGNLNNLAIINMKNGNLKQADYYFQQAIEKGLFYTTRVNYANFLLYYLKDYARTQTFAAESIKLYPKSPDLWLALAQAHYNQDHYDDALTAAQIALKLKPYAFAYQVLTAIKTHQPINTSSLELN